MKIETVSERNIESMCRELASRDSKLALIHKTCGTPPLWDREPGFATLLQIILEQQVSLASAKACFEKLTATVGDVTPSIMLSLDDAELKRIGFSRQKIAYARHLSEAVLEKRIDLDGLCVMSDAGAKAALVKLKGVGEWTSDIYLLMAMLRSDVMPRGDVALHTAWHELSGERRPTADEFILMAEKWKPFRSVAARLLWYFYLSRRSRI